MTDFFYELDPFQALRRRDVTTEIMGASQSTRSAPPLPNQIEGEMQKNHSQLDDILVPDEDDELSEILARYAPVFAAMEAQSSAQHIATSHRIITLHAQLSRLKKMWGPLAKGDENRTSLTTMYADLWALQMTRVKFCGIEKEDVATSGDVIHGWIPKALLDAILLLMSEVFVLERQLLGLLENPTKGCHEYTTGSAGAKKLRDTLQSLAENSYVSIRTLWDRTREKAQAKKREEVLLKEREARNLLMAEACVVPASNDVLVTDLKQENKALLATSREKDEKMVRMRDENIELLKTLANCISVTDYQLNIAKLGSENDELRQRLAKKQEDCKEMDQTCQKLTVLMNSHTDRLNEIAEFAKEIERVKVDNSELQNKVDDLRQRLKKENVEQLKVENAKLRGQDNNAEELRKQIHRLEEKQKAKESKAKEVNEELRKTRTQLQAAHVRLKDNEKAIKSETDGSQADSPENEELRARLWKLTFADGATLLLTYQKTVLRDMRWQIRNLAVPRGGSAWDIVTRTEMIVVERTGQLLKLIDACFKNERFIRRVEQQEESRVEQPKWEEPLPHVEF